MGEEQHLEEIEAGEFEINEYENMALSTVIEWLEHIKAKNIPPEHRETATLSVSEYYGTSTLTVDFKRPETDDEQHARKVREAHNAASVERSEREQYERLKAKFEKEEE